MIEVAVATALAFPFWDRTSWIVLVTAPTLRLLTTMELSSSSQGRTKSTCSVRMSGWFRAAKAGDVAKCVVAV